MRLVLALALSLAFAMGTSSEAPQQDHFSYADGNRLLLSCQALDSTARDYQTGLDRVYCLGYVSGVYDASKTLRYSVAQARAETLPPLFCDPDGGIEIGQAARIVLKWLRNNPEKLHLEGDISVLQALRDAFPCK
jgi:hypothetical protein